MELDNWLERSRLLKQKLTDGRTDRRTTDDGRKVITIAYLVRLRLSGKLKSKTFQILQEASASLCPRLATGLISLTINDLCVFLSAALLNKQEGHDGPDIAHLCQ